MHRLNKVNKVEQEFDLAIKRLKLCVQTQKIRHQYDWDDEPPAEAKEAAQQKLSLMDETYFNTPLISRYIDRENLWKLGVDGKDHQCDKYAYDTGYNTSRTSEPGYLNAMETALAFVFKTIDAKLTPDFIHRLHHLCCYGTRSNEFGIITSGSYEGDIWDRGEFNLQSFASDEITVTRDALNEMASYDYMTFNFFDFDEKAWVRLTPETLEDHCKKLSSGKRYQGHLAGLDFNKHAPIVLERIIKEYDNAIKQSKGNDDRILAISVLAKKLECGHFFPDGNLRTVRLIIIKLLIQNDLSLTCIDEPNLFDRLSSLEMVPHIKEGMKRYQQIKDQLKKDRVAEEMGNQKKQAPPTQSVTLANHANSLYKEAPKKFTFTVPPFKVIQKTKKR